jgi:hypothetical protein
MLLNGLQKTEESKKETTNKELGEGRNTPNKDEAQVSEALPVLPETQAILW